MAQSPGRGEWLCPCFPLLFPYPFNPIDGGNRFWGYCSAVQFYCSVFSCVRGIRTQR